MCYDSAAMYQKILRQNFVCFEKLADFLLLNDEQRGRLTARPNFPLKLPMRLAQKIEKGTLDDPILKQFLPTIDEEADLAGFVLDPVGDRHSQKTERLLHKYHGRVLLVTTGVCAMHCRYCFRQNFSYGEGEATFQNELRYIRDEITIREVILSGGDPLSLPNRVLRGLLKALSGIPHVKHIRFHSRFPLGIPERIDGEFLSILEGLPQHIWFVLHCNHARELDRDIADAMGTLKKQGVTLLNQAVLLKGVNDSLEALKTLSEALLDCGILPYYLHQLDRVRGTFHFEVEEKRGLQLIDQLKAVLPGYAVPRYVKEIAGEASKSALF